MNFVPEKFKINPDQAQQNFESMSHMKPLSEYSLTELQDKLVKLNQDPELKELQERYSEGFGGVLDQIQEKEQEIEKVRIEISKRFPTPEEQPQKKVA